MPIELLIMIIVECKNAIDWAYIFGFLPFRFKLDFYAERDYTFNDKFQNHGSQTGKTQAICSKVFNSVWSLPESS